MTDVDSQGQKAEPQPTEVAEEPKPTEAAATAAEEEEPKTANEGSGVNGHDEVSIFA